MFAVKNIRTGFTISLLAVLSTCTITLPSIAQELILKQNNEDGVYDIGDTIRWTVTVQEGDPALLKQVPYTLKLNGLKAYEEGYLDLSNGSDTVETSLSEPGGVMLDIITVHPDSLPPSDGLNPAPGRFPDGALVAPQRIEPSVPKPDDFDSFWARNLARLERIPLNASVTPGSCDTPDIEYATIVMDNIDDSHVYGQLAKPAGDGPYPALLIVQWAGVYGLQKQWVTSRAAQGWLTLNVEAHDIPGDRPPEYYRELGLNDYFTIGNDDPATSYFLRMYLSCRQAVKYLAQHADWDGKTLVVMGTSQGGQQALITAALNPEVTAMMACVPAGCDVAGPRHGRAAGFPYWEREATREQNDAILETGSYYDPAQFASRITCPSLVALGLFDETCPPVGVYSAVNKIQGPTEVLVMHSPHQNWRNGQAPYNTRSEEWLATMRQGQPAPVK